MSKKNIIFITIDECKASALSTYGNSFSQTPGAERALKNGVMFQNAFTVHPKCVPSRSAMYTGRYVHTEGHRTLPGFEISRKETNLISLLKSEGYETALFGKNHIVDDSLVPELFDRYSSDATEEKKESPARSEPDWSDKMWRSFYRGKWDESFTSPPSDFYDVQEAIDFIKEKRDRPFFLSLNLRFPHPVYREMPGFIESIREKNMPLPPKEELSDASDFLRWYRETYDVEDLTPENTKQIAEAYLSMVSYVDTLVESVYQAVDKKGLNEETIIIYTSDHGDFAGEHGAYEKFDTMFYDCLVKIPLFIQYPPVLKEGSILDSMVENVDLMPTILELAGLDIPEGVHGKSLVPYMTGKTSEHKQFVFSEGGVEREAIDRAPHCSSPLMDRVYPTYYLKQKVLNDHPSIMMRSKMIRSKEWKFIFREDGSRELYNLIEDPYELHECYKENREITIPLLEELLKWEIRTETDRPVIKILSA